MISVEYRKLLSWGFDLRGDCLISRATRNKAGYRVVAVSKKLSYAHRVTYLQWKGEMPKGFVTDHECHNRDAALGLCKGGDSCWHRSCVNPDHLVAKTSGNNSRSSSLVRGRTKTHCKRGHEYTEDSVYWPKNGAPRQCKQCKNLRGREYWHAAKGK